MRSALRRRSTQDVHTRPAKKKAHRGAHSDPFYDREASRYEDPIASREFILETLAEAGVPLEDEHERRYQSGDTIRISAGRRAGKRTERTERTGEVEEI